MLCKDRKFQKRIFSLKTPVDLSSLNLVQAGWSGASLNPSFI
jgi:hypothetical protein